MSIISCIIHFELTKHWNCVWKMHESIMFSFISHWQLDHRRRTIFWSRQFVCDSSHGQFSEIISDHSKVLPYDGHWITAIGSNTFLSFEEVFLCTDHNVAICITIWLPFIENWNHSEICVLFVWYVNGPMHSSGIWDNGLANVSHFEVYSNVWKVHRKEWVN